jgi:hypothetical protein
MGKFVKIAGVSVTAQKRAELAAVRAQIKEALEAKKATKAILAEARAAAKAKREARALAKVEAQIAKANARLEKIKAASIAKEVGPVGAKAIKSNRKASACTVTTFA